jgi:hypothetical protein
MKTNPLAGVAPLVNNLRLGFIRRGGPTRGIVAPGKVFEKICCLNSFTERLGRIGPDEAVRMRIELSHRSNPRRDNGKSKAVARHQIRSRSGHAGDYTETDGNGE